MKPQEGIVATSFKTGDKVFIGGDKLLPLEKYVLPLPLSHLRSKLTCDTGSFPSLRPRLVLSPSALVVPAVAAVVLLAAVAVSVVAVVAASVAAVVPPVAVVASVVVAVAVVAPAASLAVVAAASEAVVPVVAVSVVAGETDLDR